MTPPTLSPLTGAEERNEFVVSSIIMVVAITICELLVSKLFLHKSLRFRNNLVSLASNMLLVLPVRFPVLFPWALPTKAAIIMGFESFELACLVFNMRAAPQGGGGRAAQYIHHGTCVLMGIASMSHYASLPDDERLAWAAILTGMCLTTTTSIFLSARIVFPGVFADLVFAVMFIYIRLIENPIEYFRFSRDYGSFSDFAPSTCGILFGWTVFSVLNFYWGYCLILKMYAKIFKQGKEKATQRD